MVYLPPFQSLLATAGLSPVDRLFTLPFPFIVRGADEPRRHLVRHRMVSAAIDPQASAQAGKPSSARR